MVHPMPITSQISDRRAPGRPATRTPDQTRALLTEAAAQEFLEKGYARSSVQSVAARAGVSTKTLYRFVANKAELAALTAEYWIAVQIATHTEPTLPSAASTGGQDGLVALMGTYLDLMLSGETRQVSRMIMTEMDAYPELLETYQSSAGKLSRAFDERLAALADAGEIACENLPVAADLLRSMVSGLQRQVMLGQRSPLDASEREVWVAQCCAFLRQGSRGLRADMEQDV